MWTKDYVDSGNGLPIKSFYKKCSFCYPVYDKGLYLMTQIHYKRVMGIFRWMGSHFHDGIDYNGVALSIELLEWGRTFSDFLG